MVMLSRTRDGKDAYEFARHRFRESTDMMEGREWLVWVDPVGRLTMALPMAEAEHMAWQFRARWINLYYQGVIPE